MNEHAMLARSASAEIEVQEDRTIRIVFPVEKRYLTNRLGYRFQVRDENGRWLGRITLVDDTGSYFYVDGLDWIDEQRSELHEIVSLLVERALVVYLPVTLEDYIPALVSLLKDCESAHSISDAIKKHLTDIALGPESNYLVIKASTVARQLATYLVAHEVGDFSPEDAEEIIGSRLGIQSNIYQRVYLMDNVSGPFTREEMGIIQQALGNDRLDVPLDSRIITQLCADWGLRPIQIALLKESDFHYNPQTDLYWLNVPRVKQKQRERRGQFKKRMISNRLGWLIEQMIEANQWTKAFFGEEDMPLFQRRFQSGLKEENGTVSVRQNLFHPHSHLYVGEKKNFSFHLGSYAILSRIKELEGLLPNSPRTKSPFNLTAYRFRYTLGTASVTQGMTAAEVAERLDHSNTDSVRHYFKNTEHLWEVIQTATSARVEQRDFVARFMARESDSTNLYRKEISERKTFTTVGGCYKGSPCHLEPAVACYSCSEFRPNDNTAGHKKAKEVIICMFEIAKNNSSTGEIRHVFDDALAGVEAAIVYSERPDAIFNINDNELKNAALGQLERCHSLEESNE